MPGRPQEVVLGEDAPILEVMQTMRAMRRLAPDPVPDALLERLVEAATWAPSGSNAQQYQFIVVTDRAVMAEIGVLWRRVVAAYLKSLGAVTPEVMEDAAYGRMVDAIKHQAEHFDATPALIVPCYSSAATQRRVGVRRTLALFSSLGAVDGLRMVGRLPRMGPVSEGSSIYPGVQNLLLTARALGLAANITAWHLFLEHEFNRVLRVPRGVHTYALIPVGWPEGRMGPVKRRPVAEVIHRDRW